MTEFLITGANGFLGKYIVNAASNRSFRTLGLSGCDYNVDLSTMVPEFEETFSKVIHAAGLAHIQPESKKTDQRFFEVNEIGTANLLKGLEKFPHPPKSLVFISTVAVYGLDEGENLDESTLLRGNTPYALSKIKAEELITNYGTKHNVKTLILRLPLIVGKNPPGNLGSMICALKKGYYFGIDDGSARRSMVLATDVASLVVFGTGKSGIYNLTDGQHPSISDFEKALATRLNRKIKHIPDQLVRVAAKTGDYMRFIPINTLRYKKINSTLTFSDEKARHELNWNPRPVLIHIDI